MATMEDCTCPICLCILIEPVTMPCKHSLCFPCYKQTVEKANLCCPLCRLRISVWARKSAKAGTLVDGAKWAAIKKAFPVLVQKRLEGKETLEDDNDLENYETRLRQLMAVSKPGEIREEYEAELEKLQRRRQEEAKMEEEASAALIRSLQQEEEREREAQARLKEEQDMLDREVAEKLQETFVSKDEAIFSETEAFTKSLTTLEGSSKLLDKTAASKIKRGKGKQLKPASSNNLTMATFFSPVPRETGPTSPICGNMTPRKLHMDSCDSADLRSHTFPCDMASDEALSRIPALETKGFISSSVHCLEHKHPEVNVFVKPGGSLEDPTVGGCGDVCGTNLSLKTSDRLAAGPSGLGKYGTVTSFQELRAQIPDKASKDIARSKHAHTMPQRQLFGIYNRVSSTPVSCCSVGDHSGSLLAAGVEAAHLGLASSRVRSSEISSRILNQLDDRLTESGDGSTQKSNDTVNGGTLDDDDDVHANDSDDSIISSYNDLSDSDSCTDFLEDLDPCRQETLCKPSLEKQFETCLAKSKFNSEKEIRIGIDSEQNKDVKDHHQRLNPTVKMFRVKTHSAKKPKKSTVVPFLGGKTDPVISIMRWCVPNDCQDEPENGLQTKNAIVDNPSVFVDKFEPRHRNNPSVFVDELAPRPRNDPSVFVDELEQRHRNNLSVFNYFGKRKDTTDDDNKKEHVFDDSKRSNHIHNVNRGNCIANDSDEFSRKKKRLKNDSVIGSSDSVGQETLAVDIIDLDDVDLIEMSQEERDHLIAVQLQEIYSDLDKKNIAVDRFKGSKDQYMLRKKSARK